MATHIKMATYKYSLIGETNRALKPMARPKALAWMGLEV